MGPENKVHTRKIQPKYILAQMRFFLATARKWCNVRISLATARKSANCKKALDSKGYEEYRNYKFQVESDRCCITCHYIRIHNGSWCTWT